ncbi:histone acetyltransferase [Podila epigama]|nr:histone acetyltransferase [Podila epigama]
MSDAPSSPPNPQVAEDVDIEPTTQTQPEETTQTEETTPLASHNELNEPDQTLMSTDETNEHVVPQQHLSTDLDNPSPQQFSPKETTMTQEEKDDKTNDNNNNKDTLPTTDTDVLDSNHDTSEQTSVSGSTTQTNTPTIPPTDTVPANDTLSIAYPPVNKPLDELTMDERMIKVARSCPCEEFEAGTMCECQNWRPSLPVGETVSQELCVCGHKLSSHGGPWIGEEFDRRLKAAFRRDELLQDKGKLLDFEYTDEDIASIRKQIIPRPNFSEDVEISSPATLPPVDSTEKRSRQSSISEAKEDGVEIKEEQMDDTEERESKRVRLESEDITLKDASEETNLNGTDGPSQSDEREPTPDQNSADMLDEEDEIPVKKEKPAVIEEREGLIEFRVITNDGSRESMVLLTGMKNIFQKQLPKMPREYIARLVYDSMAIVKAPLVVLGGITYRPFNHRKFAEIVFCAITSTEQVKGYGSHLMNHLKDYISEHTQVRHFLTYADNYAIGYFKKQGFTKDITLDRSIWMGYIKDYEGGTIMQCTTVPKVKYLDVNNLLATQRKAVITKIKEVTKSHIIYPGLQDFKDGATSVDPMTVPGIKESGWDPIMDTTPRVPKHGQYYNAMKHIVSELVKDASSWPFLTPVDVEAVTDYYSYIKDPMDLATLEANVDADVYETLDDFAVDCKKIFDNCRIYNGEGTPYVKCANKLEKVFKDKLKEWKEA